MNTFRFIGIGTELHHQYPVGRSPFILASTHRAPPVAVPFLSVVAVSVSDTHQLWSSRGKLLQCGQIYDSDLDTHTDILCQDFCENGHSRNTCSMKLERKYLDGNAFFTLYKNGLFLLVHVDDVKNDSKERKA